jgi:hypothetical protein
MGKSLYKYCMNVDDGCIMRSWRSCLFSYIVARTNSILMRWSQSCTSPKFLVYSLIVLDHRKYSPWVDMFLHSDTLSWYKANRSVVLLQVWRRSNKYQFYGLWIDPHTPTIEDWQMANKQHLESCSTSY